MQGRRPRRVSGGGEEGPPVQHGAGEAAEKDPSRWLKTAVAILKRLPRSGWVELGVKRAETVASHSYGVALLAMVEASRRNLDVLKAVEMALIHDLPESYLGDLTPALKQKIRPRLLKVVEKSVLNQLLQGLPPGLRQRYAELYSEYLYRSSPEARLVHKLDRVDLLNEASWLKKHHGFDTSRFT
ncbi:MAG: HD domain-containing protein [Candidatus Caldarchaeum sp.]